MIFIDGDHPRTAAGKFSEKPQTQPDTQLSQTEQLTVTWRHPVTQLTSEIGTLERFGSRYRFAYLPAARDVDGFRGLLGFPEFDEHYESDRLFALFAQRTMSPDRPDFDEYIRGMGLDGFPSPWQQLQVNGGFSSGDNVEIIPDPNARRD